MIKLSLRFGALLLGLLPACGGDDGAKEPGGAAPQVAPGFKDVLPTAAVLQIPRPKNDGATKTSGGVGESSQALEAVAPAYTDLDANIATINDDTDYYFRYVDLALAEKPSVEDERLHEWRAPLTEPAGHELSLKVSTTDNVRFVFEGAAGPLGFEPDASNILFDGTTEARGAKADWVYTLRLHLDVLNDIERDATTDLSGEIAAAGHPSPDGGWEVFYDMKAVGVQLGDLHATQDVAATYRRFPDESSSLDVTGAVRVGDEGGADPSKSVTRSYSRWKAGGGRTDLESMNGPSAVTSSDCWVQEGAEVFSAWATLENATYSGALDGTESACVVTRLEGHPKPETFTVLPPSWADVQFAAEGIDPKSMWRVVVVAAEVVDQGGWDPEGLPDLEVLVFSIKDQENQISTQTHAETTSFETNGPTISLSMEELLETGFGMALLDFDASEAEVSQPEPFDLGDGTFAETIGVGQPNLDSSMFSGEAYMVDFTRDGVGFRIAFLLEPAQ